MDREIGGNFGDGSNNAEYRQGDDDIAGQDKGRSSPGQGLSCVLLSAMPFFGHPQLIWIP